MKTQWFRIINYTMSTIKYCLAIFMILAGIATMLSPLAPVGTGALGYIFAHHWTLYSLGGIFSGSGLWLLAGKIFKKKYWVGHSLMLIFCCFLFASLLQGAAFDWAFGFWMPNMVAALGVGLVWLWWRFKTHYLNLHDFRKEAIKLDKYHKL